MVFGQLFHRIISDNMAASGLPINMDLIPGAMLLPTISSLLGLLFAVFITYRQKRSYNDLPIAGDSGEEDEQSYRKSSIILAVVAVIVTVGVQWIYPDSMVPAALAGVTVLLLTGAIRFNQADQVVTEGMKMMAFIGFVMLAAAGFADVIRATGDIEQLVNSVAGLINGNQVIAVFLNDDCWFNYNTRNWIVLFNDTDYNSTVCPFRD